MCRRCRLVYTSPRMDAVELKRFYEGEYHALYVDRLYADEPAEEGPPEAHVRNTEQVAAERMALLQSAVEVPGKRVLDVGCGTGSFLSLVVGAGGQATGVEVAPAYVEFARRRYGLDVFGGTLEQFASVNQEHYDVVTLFHVLEHLPSPSAALRAIRGVLKEDGVLALQVPSVLHNFAAGRTDLYMFLRAAHLYNFTERSLSNLLGVTGFSVAALYRVDPRYLFAVARPGAPAPLGDTDSLGKMMVYFRAWQLWTAQRRWRRQARAGARAVAFALLGEARARRWVARIRGT